VTCTIKVRGANGEVLKALPSDFMAPEVIAKKETGNPDSLTTSDNSHSVTIYEMEPQSDFTEVVIKSPLLRILVA
jgi:hypothetical protein